VELNLDAVVYGHIGPFALNATIVFTWIVMALVVVVARLVTRRLSTGPEVPRGQILLEALVDGLRNHVREVSQQEPGPFLPFVGTLFLFIAVSNVLGIVPGWRPPTASLSTTTALALAVFVAVPAFGVAEQGVRGYLRNYVRPSVLMLPFNVIGEISRTIALAVRLYGNVMSGTIIVAILIGIVPFVFPIALRLLGMLTGLIQAYIFAVLAMVYIAAATRSVTDHARGRTDDTRAAS